MSHIESFPLAWRWTQSSHTLFTPLELAALHPYSAEEAARIHDRALRLLEGDGLSPVHFEQIASLSAERSKAEVTAWLRERFPNPNAQVTISWLRHLALRTTWQIFTGHWDDFCYPSSDDVVVLPEDGSWLLLYHHEEIFTFGTRKL